MGEEVQFSDKFNKLFERLVKANEGMVDKLDSIIFQLEEIDKSLAYISPSIDKIGDNEQ